MKIFRRALPVSPLILAGTLVVAPVAAQAQPAVAPAASAANADDEQHPPRRLGELDPVRASMLRNRYHMRQMESVLVRAVEHAAEVMSHRLTTVSPDVMALAGAPRAQGFRIEGHGLFFSVEVPRLSDSMNWALQVLSSNRDDRTLVTLQRIAEAQSDPALRADVERAIRALERQMVRRAPAPRRTSTGGRDHEGPVAVASAGNRPPVAADAVVASTADVDLEASASEPASASDSTPAPDVDVSILANPSAAYEQEVKAALADALLDYALTLPLAPGETVTVAARDAGYIAFPDAVTEMVTVTLSVSVDDLLAFRRQVIDRDEARRRVRVREF